jgi:glutamate racemase
LPPTEISTQGAIGVFDSGIGGLSVLQALRAEMPQERFIYWSDSAFAPYGERSDEFVIQRSHFITEQLMAKGHVKCVVVACNTATAVAIESLRHKYPHLPFVGVEPALKPAIGITQTGRVGVIGTHGTLQSARFEKLLKSVQADAAPKTFEFVIQACKGLALAIEHQTEKETTDTQEVERLCAHYLQAMGPFGQAPGQIDSLVLGCTHYVFVQELLSRLLGPHVHIISTGEAVAKQTHRLIAHKHIDATVSANMSAQDAVQLWTTGSLSALAQAADQWLKLPSACCHLFEDKAKTP